LLLTGSAGTVLLGLASLVNLPAGLMHVAMSKLDFVALVLAKLNKFPQNTVVIKGGVERLRDATMEL
jgi:hypothetical protein